MLSALGHVPITNVTIDTKQDIYIIAGKCKKLSVTWQTSDCNGLAQVAIIEILGYVASTSRNDDKNEQKLLTITTI